MEDFEGGIRKQHHQAILDQFRDSNKAMIDFSKMALRGTMLLNGAAVIPIVYAKSTDLYFCAMIFGIGAALSVCASCLTYLTQWAITGSWQYALHMHAKGKEELEKFNQSVQRAKRCEKISKILRIAAIGAAALSLFACAVGLHQASLATSNTPKMAELRVYLEPAPAPQ